MKPEETYILCEGYHDRAFWAGALTQLGCRDAREQADGTKVPVTDPWGASVKGSGQFAFRTKADHFIRIVPSHTRDKLLPFAESRLRNHHQKTLRQLVISTDADAAVGDADGRGGLTFEAVFAAARKVDETAVADPNAGAVVLGGNLHISLMRWATGSVDDQLGGLPGFQTLERIICLAMVRSYPGRAAPVESWLASRPEAPPRYPKEHSWSYIAGWYATSGSYEGAITRFWRDPILSRALVEILRETALWDKFVEIAST